MKVDMATKPTNEESRRQANAIERTAREWQNIPWQAKDSVEWIYERPQGDIVVFARCVEEAIEAIHSGGFTKIDSSKVKAGKRELADVIQPIDVK